MNSGIANQDIPPGLLERGMPLDETTRHEALHIVQHAAMNFFSALQILRQVLLADQHDRVPAAFVNATQNPDDAALDQILRIINDQHLLREHQLLGNLVDHVRDHLGGL